MMAANTNIEWADHTFNAWTGCDPVSPGCKGCYAEAWAKRAGRDFAERKRTTADYWKQPLRWNSTPFGECPACGGRGHYQKGFKGIGWMDWCPRCEGTRQLEVAPKLKPARPRIFVNSLAD